MKLNEINVRQDGATDDDLDEHNVLVAKGVAMGVLFLAALITGCFPFFMVRLLRWDMTKPSKTASRFISLALAFGGGVLLATTWLHLFPEVRHSIEELQSNHSLPETNFPLAELLMCVGFFFIYLVSELVHSYIKRQNRPVKPAELECALPRCPNGTVPIAETAELPKESLSNGASNGHHANGHHANGHHVNDHHVNGHSHLHLPDTNCTTNDTLVVALRGLLIVLALSVHELFEGMALGLSTSTTSVWLFLGAIASHKLVLAFCVGIELLVAKTSRTLTFSYILLFSVVSPIGIGIGMAVSESSGSAIVGVVLQAMATGTLVYVVFFEILKKSGSGLLQYVAVIIGFFIMFGLQQIGKLQSLIHIPYLLKFTEPFTNTIF